jgi:hypothetical protein
MIVEVQRGTAPPRRGALWFPAEDQTYIQDRLVDLTAVPAVEAAS